MSNKYDETDDIDYDDDVLSEYGDIDEIDDVDDLEGYWAKQNKNYAYKYGVIKNINIIIQDMGQNGFSFCPSFYVTEEKQ